MGATRDGVGGQKQTACYTDEKDVTYALSLRFRAAIASWIYGLNYS